MQQELSMAQYRIQHDNKMLKKVRNFLFRQIFLDFKIGYIQCYG